MGEWLEDLPPESEGLEEVAPEDAIDLDAYEEAIRAHRDGAPLVLGAGTEFDQQEYELLLDQERRGRRPPGLRMSRGLSDERCDTCSHFDRGICGLYTYVVRPDEVCDSWDAAE